MNQRITVIAITVSIVAVLFLVLFSAGGSNIHLFTRFYREMLVLGGVIALSLFALVGIQLRNLWREYRQRRFGSRIRLHLILRFALFALLPGLMIYLVSLLFVVRSIDNWFDVRVDRALEGGIALGQNALDYLVQQTRAHAESIALNLEGQGLVSAITLNRMREQAGVASIAYFNSNGQILTTASDGSTALLPSLPTPAQLRQARTRRHHFQLVESSDDGARHVIRVIVPVFSGSMLSETNYLQITQPVPNTFSEHINAVQEAWQDYQQIILTREGLNRIYQLTLTLTLLLALLSAFAISFFFARRFASPLLDLVRGTQAVAQGNLGFRLAQPQRTRTELDSLLQSFNHMLRELQDARAQNVRNQNAIEASRAYLESILAHLSTGVLAFDAQLYMRAANRGAAAILQDSLEGFENLPLAEWPRQHALRDILLEHLQSSSAEWEAQEECLAEDHHGNKTLHIRGARLPEVSGGGHVVVFDDITRLVLAQRTAAWAEVARRLAHEIKNPLTPIQLSAERLSYKLAPRLDTEGQQILERSTATIINQVEAMKNLVNDFRDYARLPTPKFLPVDLAALLQEILDLYESSAVRIVTHFEPDLPLLFADAAQIRQIIHNLLQNAEDALAEHPAPKLEITATRLDARHARLIFCDNGSGFPPELLTRAFEPYFTTKSKGTGLGLAIIKKIVDEHGGEVRIGNSHETGGAFISMTLPLYLPETDDTHHGQHPHR
ncbi:MAG: HAMP domain-containing protein [Rhodocyclaceae bacterium]|nr:HAMP domain-containing protein [Rhodocyclaceae bacterium]